MTPKWLKMKILKRYIYLKILHNNIVKYNNNILAHKICLMI
jgi:hypothetical protein